MSRPYAQRLMALRAAKSPGCGCAHAHAHAHAHQSQMPQMTTDADERHAVKHLSPSEPSETQGAA